VTIHSCNASSRGARPSRALVQIAPRVLNPIEAARYIGVGRTKMFELLKEGKIPAKKSGSQSWSRSRRSMRGLMGCRV
jgi:excisionase family DNA binding protein